MDFNLCDTFILYLHYKNLGCCYNENLEKLMEIDNIQTFWQTINNVPKPTFIFSDGVNTKVMKRNNSTPCAYSFFRKNVHPCWEDPNNSSGFELSIKTSKNLETFDEIFINSLVELLTNKENYNLINGIRIVDCTKFSSVMYRIEFWINNEEHKCLLEKILKTQFNIEHRLMYKSHKNVKELI